ncbi:MAG: beta-lactamase family protein [Sandaracinaceae bacterium]|nr:beta-lactamase family protein [Myxococcales bacterium]MCB9658475.1 beta-lactamase family protein [Sandaracinaceae bacterium]
MLDPPHARIRPSHTRGPARLLLSVMLAACFVGTASCAGAPSCPAFQDTLSIEDNALSCVSAHVPPPAAGIALVVVDDGDVVLRTSHGEVNQAEHLPATPSTPFYLASVSKPFTAMAVLLLVERGRLQLEDTLDRWFPEAGVLWGEVTVHHLLTHQSGIEDYFAITRGGTSGMTNADVLHLVAERPLLFTPGSRHQYSNSGYALAATLVERASGEDFATFLTDEIFTPLGMTHSYVQTPTREPDAFAVSYAPDGTALPYTLRTYGDGGVFASADDLGRWLIAVGRGEILSAAMWERALTSHQGHGYGYGFFLGQGGEDVVGHNGGLAGFRNVVRFDRARQRSVVLLSNGAFDGWILSLADALMED